MGFSRQGYWSRLPFPSPADLPNPGIEPGSPTLQADSFRTHIKKSGSTEQIVNIFTQKAIIKDLLFDEWIKSDREGEILYDILYMWNLKRNDTNELTKQKETHRLREWAYGCQGEGIVREFGIDMYTLLYLKWIANKELVYNTGNSAQCYVAAWMGGEYQENGYMCMCGWVALLCTWNCGNIVNWLQHSTN